jgi:hypothetical protein
LTTWFVGDVPLWLGVETGECLGKIILAFMLFSCGFIHVCAFCVLPYDDHDMFWDVFLFVWVFLSLLDSSSVSQEVFDTFLGYSVATLLLVFGQFFVTFVSSFNGA